MNDDDRTAARTTAQSGSFVAPPQYTEPSIAAFAPARAHTAL